MQHKEHLIFFMQHANALRIPRATMRDTVFQLQHINARSTVCVTLATLSILIATRRSSRMCPWLKHFSHFRSVTYSTHHEEHLRIKKRTTKTRTTRRTRTTITRTTKTLPATTLTQHITTQQKHRQQHLTSHHFLNQTHLVLVLSSSGPLDASLSASPAPRNPSPPPWSLCRHCRVWRRRVGAWKGKSWLRGGLGGGRRLVRKDRSGDACV